MRHNVLIVLLLDGAALGKLAIHTCILTPKVDTCGSNRQRGRGKQLRFHAAAEA